jgi:hypothetical protein
MAIPDPNNDYRPRSERLIASAVQRSIVERPVLELGDSIMFVVEIITQHREFVLRMHDRSRGFYIYRHMFPANTEMTENDGAYVVRGCR